MLRGSHRFTATGCVPKVRLSPLSQLRSAITGEIGLPRNNSPDTLREACVTGCNGTLADTSTIIFVVKLRVLSE
jgi:hypothetical protein